MGRRGSTSKDRAHRYEQRGEFDRAVGCYKHWLADHPGDDAAWHDLAGVLFSLGSLSDAENAASKAIDLNPDLVDGYIRLAHIQSARGQTGTPLHTIKAAIRRDPTNLELVHQMGMFFIDQFHLEQAVRAFQLVLTRKPDHAESVAGLALALERMGQLDDAYQLLKPWMRRKDAHPRMGHAWGPICRRLKRPEEGIAALEAMIVRHDVSKSWSKMLLFELGPLYEAVGRYDDAWKAITVANRVSPYICDPKAIVARVDRLIDGFDAETIARIPRASRSSNKPVLIVGAPRSGTSLTEQILSAHPAVHGAGELGDLQLVERVLERATGRQFPDGLVDISQSALDEVNNWYLDRRDSQAPAALRVTDKMPDNFAYLGLIPALLPGATVIHCIRNPRDVAASCYFQNFRSGLAWSQRVEWIEIYLAQYRRLMAHWASVLPITVHEFRYEALVEKPEDQIRRLVAACGLDWDPACMSFHQAKRSVATASYAQANRPIYRSSKGRGEHYAQHLQAIPSAW